MPRFQPRRAVENLIVNPQCLIAQEGTAFTAMSSGDYVLDGFQYQKSGAMVHTGSQATDHPAATGKLYDGYKCLKLDCTTADASLAAGDYCAVVAYVEGYHALRCYEVPCVLTFWHKHTKTGVHCVAISNAGSDRTLVKEYSQAVADTWEKTTLIIPASPSAGTWDQSNGIGLEIRFTLAAGSNYQTTAGSWNTGNYYATASQVNSCDSTANNFQLAEVALYTGSCDLGFYAPDFEQQLARCQRYFEKSYALNTNPGTATGNNMLQDVAADSNFTYGFDNQFAEQKRTSPTVTLYNANNGAAGQVSRYTLGTTWQANVSASASNVGPNGFATYGAGNFSASDLLRYHFTADARF